MLAFKRLRLLLDKRQTERASQRLLRRLSSVAETVRAQYETLKPQEMASSRVPKMTTLPNGLRVVTEAIPHNRHTATVGLWVKTGSRYETPENNGCAHFLEHMAFKGTAKRSQKALEREVENMGAHLNAYTSRDLTNYFASVMQPDVPRAVDILADIVTNSKFSPADLERERSTIQTEYREVYKDKQEYVFDYLHETAFPKDPLGQTILGPLENIAKLSRADLVEYVKTHYRPDQMALVAAGAVDHERLVGMAEEKLGALRARPDVEAPKAMAAQYVGGEYRERQDDMELAHVAVGFKTCGWSDPDNFPLLFMHQLLGSWEKGAPHGEHSSSRLVSTVSSYHYVERIMPFNTVYSDTGLFGIYFAAYESRLHETASCVMRALCELSDNVTDQQVEEVRNKLVTAALSPIDSTDELCEELGRQVLTCGRKMPAAEFVARLNAVDASAVRLAAKRFIYDKDLSLSAVGPIVELPPYPWFRRHTYSLTH